MYNGYYGTMLFAHVLSSSYAKKTDSLLNYISFSDEDFDGKKLSFTYENSFLTSLQYSKTIGKGQFQLINQTKARYQSTNFQPSLKGVNTIKKCDWSNKDNNYVTEFSLFTILIIDNDIQLYDLVQAAIVDQSFSSLEHIYFYVFFNPLRRDRSTFIMQLIEYISLYSNGCIISETASNLVINSTEFEDPLRNTTLITYGMWDGKECDNDIFHFGPNIMKILSISSAIPIQQHYCHYYYITSRKESDKNIDIPYLYIKNIINDNIENIVIDVEYISILDKVKIDYMFNSTVNRELTFVYIVLNNIEDYEFTDYITNTLDYDSENIQLFHFNSHYNYFKSNLNELKNQYFTITDPFYLDDSEHAKFITDIMKETNFPFDSLYVSLFYITRTAYYVDRESLSSFSEVLADNSSYSVSNYFSSYISNHQINTPVSIQYIDINNSSRYLPSPSYYVPTSSYFINESTTPTNRIPLEICDLDSTQEIRYFTPYYAALIYDSKLMSKIFLNEYELSVNTLLNSLQVNNKEYILMFLKVDMSQYQDAGKVVEYLISQNITHIFGGFFYSILEDFLPYLEPNKMMFWYFSFLPGLDICDDYILPFYVSMKSLLIISEANPLRILIYTNSTPFYRCAKEYSDVLKEEKKSSYLLAIPQPLKDEDLNKIASELLSVMTTKCMISFILRSDDEFKLVPYLKKILSLSDSLPEYSISSFTDFSIVKSNNNNNNNADAFSDIQFVTIVDVLTGNNYINNLKDLYDAFNSINSYPCTVDFYTYQGITFFISVFQKCDLNDFTCVIQEFNHLTELSQNPDVDVLPFQRSPVMATKKEDGSIVGYYYLNITYFPDIGDLSISNYCINSSKSAAGDDTDVNNNINKKECKDCFIIAILLDTSLVEIQYFQYYLTFLTFINSLFPDKKIGSYTIYVNKYLYNGNVTSFTEEILSEIKNTQIYFSLTPYILDELEVIMNENKKIMYFLYDYAGTKCSPYVFYLGLSSYSKIYPSINWVYEHCDTNFLLFPITKYGKEEYQLFLDEMYNVLFIKPVDVYGISQNVTHLEDIVVSIQKNTEGIGCIINLLSDTTTNFLIQTMNSYLTKSSSLLLLSMNLYFSKFKILSTKIPHYILTYYNAPTIDSDIYKPFLQSYEITYGVGAGINVITYNTMNALLTMKASIDKSTISRDGYDNDLVSYFKSVKIESDNYKLTFTESHHISLPRYLYRYDNQINKENGEERNGFEYELIYKSNTVYTAQLYSPTSSLVCAARNYGDKISEHKAYYIYNMGFAFSYTGMLNVVQHINILSAYASYFDLIENMNCDDPNLNEMKVKLTIFDIKSNYSYCDEMMNVFNSSFQYVIVATDFNCLNKVGDKLDNNDESYLNKPIVFETFPTCSILCNSNIISTSRTPNEILPTIMGYFNSYLFEKNKIYLVIDSSDEVCCGVYINIIKTYINNSKIGYEIYNMSDNSATFIINEIYKTPGLVMSMVSLFNFQDFIGVYTQYNMDKDTWPLVVINLPHTVLVTYLTTNQLNNIYLPSTFFNYPYISDIYDKYYLNNEDVSTSSYTYLSFLLIQTMICKAYTISDLYNLPFKNTPLGSFTLKSNNYFELPFQLLLYEYGESNIVFQTAFLFTPALYTYYTGYNMNMYCDLTEVINTDSNTDNKLKFDLKYRNLYIGIETDGYNSDFQRNIFLLITQLTNQIVVKVIRRTQFIPSVYSIYDKESLLSFFNKYINDKDAYPACIVDITSVSVDMVVPLYVKPNPNLYFYLTSSHTDYCFENLITTKKYTAAAQSIAIQQLITLFPGVSFILIYSKSYQSYYKELSSQMTSSGVSILIDRLVDDYEELENDLKLLMYKDQSYIVYIDIEEYVQVEEVENLIYDLRDDSSPPIYYIQFFEENPDFIEKTNHFFYGESYRINSTQITDVLKPLYNSTSTSIDIFNPFILSHYFQIVELYHIWFESTSKSETPNNLTDIYYQTIDTTYNQIVLNPSNIISGPLFLSYIDDNQILHEYELPTFLPSATLKLDTNPNQNITICDFVNYNGDPTLVPVYVAIISLDPSISKIHAHLSMVLFRNLIISQTIFNGLLKTHIIFPIIYYVSNNVTFSNYLQQILDSDMFLSVISVTSYDLTPFTQEIGNHNIFFFNVLHSTVSHCTDNIFDIGATTLTIARYTYIELSKFAKMAIIIKTEDDPYCTSFEKNLETFLYNTNTNITSINLSEYEEKLNKIIPTCLSKYYGECAIIITTRQTAVLSLYLYLEKFNITFGIDMELYYFRDDILLNETYRNIIENAVHISTYSATLSPENTDNYNSVTTEFTDFLSKQFIDKIEPLSIIENAYTTASIFTKLLITTSVLNYKDMFNNIRNIYFDTPSGPAYFGNDHTLIRDMFFTKTTIDSLYPVIEESRRIVNPVYLYQPCQTDKSDVNIGLIFDFDDENMRTSQISYALIVELIINQNQIGGINNRQIKSHLYSLFHDTARDEETIHNLLINGEISIIIGCYTTYCHNLLIPRISKANKLLYSLSYIQSPFCEKNVISLGLTTYHRLNQTLESIALNELKTLVLIYKKGSDTTFYKEFNITFEKEYEIKSEDQFDDIIKEIDKLSETHGISILNTLSGKYLTLFEEKYIYHNFSTNRVLQFLYDISENEIGINIMANLNGHMVIRSFIENSNDHLSMLFETLVHKRLGNNIHVIQDFALYDVALKLLLNAYKLSSQLISEDGIADNIKMELEIDYLRRASQLSEIETSCGNIIVTESNNLLYTFEVGQISALGTIMSVRSDTRPSTPQIFDRDNICSYGPIIKTYRFETWLLGLVYGISSIFWLLMISCMFLIIIYRKRLKTSSPIFLCYFVITSLITILLLGLFNTGVSNKWNCQVVVGLLFLFACNGFSALVFRTWRIHAIYNNAKMTRHRVSDTAVFIHIACVVIPDVILTLIWMFAGSIATYNISKSVQDSTSLEIVYVERCEIQLSYAVVQSVLIIILLVFGIYFSWKTRKTSSEFNDSKALPTGIGFITLIYIMIVLLEASLTYELAVKFIVETIGTSCFFFIVLALLTFPKLFKILYAERDRIFPSSSYSVANSSSKRIKDKTGSTAPVKKPLKTGESDSTKTQTPGSKVTDIEAALIKLNTNNNCKDKSNISPVKCLNKKNDHLSSVQIEGGGVSKDIENGDLRKSLKNGSVLNRSSQVNASVALPGSTITIRVNSTCQL